MGKENMYIDSVFYKESEAKIGVGSTLKKTTQKMFWQAKETDNGITIQMFMANGEMFGQPQPIDREEFFKSYILDCTYPVPVAVIDDTLFKNYTAILTEYLNAEHFYNAQSFLLNLFTACRLIKFENEDGFQGFIKYFREKEKEDLVENAYTEAIKNYSEDPVLLFNLARFYFELGKNEEAIHNLILAHEHSPDNQEIILMLFHMYKNDLVELEDRSKIKDILIAVKKAVSV